MTNAREIGRSDNVFLNQKYISGAPMCLAFAILLIMPSVGTAGRGSEMDVTVIDRQSHNETYSYIIPSYSTTNINGTGYVTAVGNSAYSSGSATGTTVTRPGISGSYQVSGATLSLKLPDNRIVVVNCDKKINWGHVDRYRGYRVPLTNNVRGRFKGAKVKLRWPISIDGKKLQEETYNILGIFDGEKTDAQ